MAKKIVLSHKKKYVKPSAKIKSLKAELRRNKEDEIGLFNLLSATCNWEQY